MCAADQDASARRIVRVHHPRHRHQGAILGKVNTVLALGRDDPSKDDQIKEVRKDINSWVAKYRREPRVSGRPSYGWVARAPSWWGAGMSGGRHGWVSACWGASCGGGAPRWVASRWGSAMAGTGRLQRRLGCPACMLFLQGALMCQQFWV